MKFRSYTSFLLAAALVAAAGGCRKLKPSSAGLSVESYAQNQVKVNSKFFDGWFRVTDISSARRNGHLHATVGVENLKSDCQFEYRFRWLDQNGIEITTGLALWRQSASGAREKVLMTGIAPTREAEDFILDMRFGYASTRW